MAILPFEIDLSTIGSERIIVDGEDLSGKLSRVVIDATANQAPRLYLEGLGLGPISGRGQVFERVDSAESVVDFLESVDPDKLERESLEGLGLGSDNEQTTTESMIALLIKWARAN